MSDIAAIITAIGGLVTGIIGAAIAINTSSKTAKKTDVDALSKTIKTLQDENARLSERLKEREDEVSALRTELDALRIEMRMSSASKDEEIANLRRELSMREIRIKELECEVRELRMQVEALQKQ